MLPEIIRQWLILALVVLMATLIVPKFLHQTSFTEKAIPLETKLVPPHLDPSMKRKTLPPQDIKVTVDPRLEKITPPAWAVQIGSYKSIDNIQPTINKLQSKGFEISVHKVNSSKGQFYRVWVGKLISRQAADHLVKRLRDDFKINGFVMRLDGNDVR